MEYDKLQLLKMNITKLKTSLINDYTNGKFRYRNSNNIKPPIEIEKDSAIEMIDKTCQSDILITGSGDNNCSVDMTELSIPNENGLVIF